MSEQEIIFQQVFHNCRNGFAGIRFETQGETYHVMLFNDGHVEFFHDRTGKSVKFPVNDLIRFGKQKLGYAVGDIDE